MAALTEQRSQESSMQAHSSTADQDGNDESSQRRTRLMRLILAHQLSTLSLSLLTMQPRMQLLRQAFDGDTAATARQIGRGAALVALSDLLLSPSAGAFSDRAGRKPLMLLAPAVALPLKLAAAIWPSAPVLLLERVLGDSLRTLGGTTMAYAALADLYTGQEYAAALSKVQAATGLGIILAPLVASAAMGRNGNNPRRPYILSALLAAIHLAIGMMFLEETSTPKVDAQPSSSAHSVVPTSGTGRKPLLQPVWRFLNLFTMGHRMRIRASLFSLHCFLEGKVIQDQASVLQLGLGWGSEDRSRWTSGLGFAILAGGQATGSLLRWVGQQSFVMACHFASFLAFLNFRRSEMWRGLAMLVLGQQRRIVSSAWIVQEATRCGYGRGEVVGWIASLRATVEAISALLYANVYRIAHGKGSPQNVFLLPSLIVILAEVQRMQIANQANRV
eukprot:TRINITY_DN5230_c0_g1_i3.p1 TRINITY_DN5230_c0_g1~~TRINITY_DN5230_c0_g1_i3.p1  ORF type:complete len:447 (+),score=69.33 TRINITY_DN5230_c0_g1_i3:28-1368(+)